MKYCYLLLVLTAFTFSSQAQLRMGVIGGPHSASVKEENSLPDWETTLKSRYSSRSGLNLGILVDVPLSSNNRWYLSPGIFYMGKGRKYYMRNDSTASMLTDTISAHNNLAVNYIDIPFNLTYKIPLGKKAKFILSAGPYAGFFYSGKQTFETRIYSSNTFNDEEVKLETGNEAGKMKTFTAGVNARAGFEIGSIILTGFMSEGLTSFYTAPYEGDFNHQVRGVSVGFWFNKVKPAQKTSVTPKDTDKDGVPDLEDACPKLAGPALTNGCPDKDDDGIADIKDICPDAAGSLKYHGCPVPDSDKDGLNDEVDSCPNEAGTPDFNGCPVRDRDKDGISDQQDNCPDEAGVLENNGCPAIPRKPAPVQKEVVEKVTMAAKNIFFRASSDVLLESSLEALDDVARLMSQHQEAIMIIEGHTDSTGSVELNKQLSQARANSVKRYLMSKGIHESRLKAQGFGSSRPLVSNETLEGRRKNRRVVLKIENGE